MSAESTFMHLLESLIDTTKNLHAKYNPDATSVKTCDELLAHVRVAEETHSQKALEIFRKCIEGQEQYIETKDDCFLKRAEEVFCGQYYANAHLLPIWDQVSVSEKDAVWKIYRRAMKACMKIASQS